VTSKINKQGCDLARKGHGNGVNGSIYKMSDSAVQLTRSINPIWIDENESKVFTLKSKINEKCQIKSVIPVQKFDCDILIPV